MQTKKIHNKTVKTIPLGPAGRDERPVRGSDYIETCFANVMLCAKKNSGKTTVIYNILKACAGPKTTIVAFVATLHKDPSWAAIQKHFEDKGIAFIGHTSLKEDGVDLLKDLVQELEKPEEKKEFKEEIPAAVLSFDEPPKSPAEKKERKDRFQTPEYIFILDDLSDEMGSPSVTALLKKNRHFRCKVILSSQYLNDLSKPARKQIDVWVLFKSLSKEKLETVYSDADLSISFDDFMKMYHEATEDEFGFLYIDTRREKFRKNFNEEFVN
jgi:hypothetical protein